MSKVRIDPHAEITDRGKIINIMDRQTEVNRSQRSSPTSRVTESADKKQHPKGRKSLKKRSTEKVAGCKICRIKTVQIGKSKYWEA